jgi:hypothetical protein
VTERPEDKNEPSKEGGHAAERLEEFLEERFPQGLPEEESPIDTQAKEEPKDEPEAVSGEEDDGTDVSQHES